jgi:hypothetical protein
MKTVPIKPSEAKQGDIIAFYGKHFVLGAIAKHEPSDHAMKHGKDFEQLPVYTCFGECINPDDQTKKDFYFNSHRDAQGNKLPTGWQFQGNDNATWYRVLTDSDKDMAILYAMDAMACEYNDAMKG